MFTSFKQEPSRFGSRGNCQDTRSFYVTAMILNVIGWLSMGPLLKAQHPNIVAVREVVVGSNMDKIFMVMDYVEHDLKSLMETLNAQIYYTTAKLVGDPSLLFYNIAPSMLKKFDFCCCSCQRGG